MKILHTVALYPPNVGGTEMGMHQVSRRLVERGHEVEVATSWDARRTSDEIDGVRVRQFKIKGNLEVGIRGETEAYRSFIRSARPDVMFNYSAHVWTTDLIRDLLDDLPGAKALLPVCFTLASVYPPEYEEQLPRMLASYDAIVCHSARAPDAVVAERLGLSSRVVFIPNGADEAEFSSTETSFRERFGIETPLMVLTVSNHYHAKGHVPLVRAFRSLRRDDATLVIIGERPGPLWRGCYVFCNAVAALSPRIRSLRGTDRSLVVDAHKAADLFVLASRIECSALVIPEAMAAGTPFVALDAGDVREREGFGVVLDGPSQLMPAMRDILENEQLRVSLGKRAREEWADSLTWDAITDRFEELYERLAR